MNSNFDVNFGKKELNMSLNIGSEELKTEIVFPAGGGNVDLTEVAKETTLNSAKEEILTAVEKGSGSITLQTQEEYARFKEYMQTKINNILNNEL